jgi:hypothetical protein
MQSVLTHAYHRRYEPEVAMIESRNHCPFPPRTLKNAAFYALFAAGDARRRFDFAKPAGMVK